MNAMNEQTVSSEQIRSCVEEVLASTDLIDVHTHLFAPAFGNLGLWGIDELLTYHYLEAEFFRSSDMPPERYWKLSKTEQADAVWQALFVENTPISEATRGIIAVLKAFDLPTGSPDLAEARSFFRNQNLEAHITRTLRMAGVSTVVMTNDPLYPAERELWMKGILPNPQFQAVLRLDRIVRDWPGHWHILEKDGYEVNSQVSGKSVSELRRFLSDWHKCMQPVYMAISLPDTFQFPEKTLQSKILRDAVLPACREFDLPLSLMIGVRYQVNPRIRLAGDGVGKADLRAVENLCHNFPDNRFLISVLSRENQHELCVYARKFSNLMPFGCWWFLNNPSIVEEITRQRIEMLGTSFIPQHSDARVLEQLIYKWQSTRGIMIGILHDAYQRLWGNGLALTRNDITHDVNRLFRANFERFTRLIERASRAT